jgi:hypothetical protein
MNSIERTTKQAKREANRTAWTAYKQAVDARADHVHVSKCEACWSGKNASFGGCPTWDRLTVEITRTLDAWIALV